MVWYVVTNPETGIIKLIFLKNEKTTLMNVRDQACSSIYFGWNEYTKLRARRATKRELLDHHVKSNHLTCKIKTFHGAYKR